MSTSNNLPPSIRQDSDQLATFILDHQPLMVITGAGCSAASGIPTYRDNAGVWLRSDPIQHQEFLNQPSKRQRYWTRSFSGWPYVSRAKPNTTHHCLTELENMGLISLLVTQNVDRLHQRSGHQRVIDLHGRLDQVRCTECYLDISRQALQLDLEALNPHLSTTLTQAAPDGDADVADELVDRTQIPECPRCGGVLKPDVVFYGGGVDKTLVDNIYTSLFQANGLLTIGSSLMVFSSFRFCRFAHHHQLPIAVLNAGKTRADDLADLKLSNDCEAVMSETLRIIKLVP